MRLFRVSPMGAVQQEHADNASRRAGTTLQKGTGPFALFADLCVFCVGTCFYRLTSAMAEKLGYVSAHGDTPGHDDCGDDGVGP